MAENILQFLPINLLITRKHIGFFQNYGVRFDFFRRFFRVGTKIAYIAQHGKESARLPLLDSRNPEETRQNIRLKRGGICVNEERTRKEPKLKPFVFVHPTTSKGKLSALLFLIVILCSIVPIISLVNKPILVLGMPLIMLWSIGIVLAVVVVLRLALHWGVK